MRVDSSSFSLASAASSFLRSRTSERLTATPPPRPPPPPPPPRPPPASAAPATAKDDSQGLDPKSKRILDLLERMFGVKGVKILKLDLQSQELSLEASSSAQRVQLGKGGLAYDRIDETASLQAAAFQAQGSFRTEDGREFAFTLESLQVVASYTRSSTSLRAGDAPPATDPLTLDLGGGFGFPGGFQPFDLDSDGVAEPMRRLAPGAGFLAYDRDGDGRVTNGRDLFGPKSGDGFRDLMVLDHDRDGDVDEADPAWSRLGVLDGSGAFSLLAKFRIGALFTSSVAAPIRLPDALGQDAALQRKLGVYVRDDGTPGRMAQLDLVG